MRPAISRAESDHPSRPSDLILCRARTRMKRAGLCVSAVLVLLAVGSSSASAAEPWWHLNSGSAPANIPPGGTGEIVVTASDLGTADANGGTGSPIKIVDTLPEHLVATAIGAEASEGTSSGSPGLGISSESVGSCTTPPILSCEYTGVIGDYSQIEVVISVKAEAGAESGELNHASVSGGGAAGAVSAAHPITISAAPTPYGVENYEMTPEEEGGKVDTQAGSHPLQLTTTLELNQTLLPGSPPAYAKDLHFNLPPGLVGNPTPFPQCSEALFLTRPEEGDDSNTCPADTAVGVAAFAINVGFGNATSATSEGHIVVPLFNLVPELGEPARFGFYYDESPVYLDTSVRTGSDYGVTVSVDNITQEVGFLSSRVTFWGVPADPRHNNARGWSCIDDEAVLHYQGPVGIGPCIIPTEEVHPPPLLALPTSCAGPLETDMETDSWKERGSSQTFPQNPLSPLPTLDGCTKLPFRPEVRVSPDVQEASKPSGLRVDVHVPQAVDLDSEGLSASDVKNIVVTLPEGLILNPSAADGLAACPLLTGREASQEEREGKGEVEGINLETPQPANCPNASKIATVTIHSPLLPKPLEGFVYLASPQNFAGLPQNPFSKHVAQYLVADDKEAGILVKLPGSVELGGEPGVTGLAPGQIRSTFANQPQLPFEDAELHFFGGERAPLATPAHCGTYTTNASFAPWSGNEPVSSQGQFAITSGAGGGSCPGSSLPFNASLESGSTNVNAGSFSELTTTLSRPNGDQNIQSVTLHYPPGVTGLISGVKLCGETEANAGTCGPESQIGESIVSVGVGGEPFTVTGGKAYITGPYEGAPFGLSIVNPAKAGPFDLQEGRPVVVRAKVEVNPLTAALTVTTNTPEQGYAIPTIIEGFPLQIQHVNVLVNRPGFSVNPTNCNKMEITGTIASAEGSNAAVSDPFQVTNCQALKFQPKFTVTTAAHATKTDGTSLVFRISYPPGAMGSDSWFKAAKFDIPKQLPARLTTIQQACLAATFEANPANCPKHSKIGEAIVRTQVLPVPLKGPVYFVSYGGAKFPDAIILLSGDNVNTRLVGETFINGKTGVTSATFPANPDVPFESIEVMLPSGEYSEFGANLPSKDHNDFCGQSLKMPTAFQAQNGLEIHQQTPVTITGCPKTKKAKAAKHNNKNNKSKRSGKTRGKRGRK
jgi:hypothetical protein